MKCIVDGSPISYSEDTCDNSTAVNVELLNQNKAPHGQDSPKVPSSLATESKKMEGKLTLIAPIVATEELDVNYSKTESKTNEGKFKLF